VFIVIATHEQQLNIRMPRSPGFNLSQRSDSPPLTRVDYVSQEYDPSCAGKPQEATEPIHVRPRGSAWNWQTRRTQSGSLAPMRIGDK
jgi:hypothetical protein